MSKSSKCKNFINYLDHLLEYQTKLLPDDKLGKDYIILYDYLMDILEKDCIIGEVIVRKKQQISNLNADILIDLTKIFDLRSFLHEPFLCLTLDGRENKRFKNIIHPFCNAKLSITPKNIKKNIWLALDRGILKNGSFVRGFQGDIYELNLPPNEPNDSRIRLTASYDDIILNISLRILVKYYGNPSNELSTNRPFPKHEFNKEWLATLSGHLNSPFDICLPKLECEVQQKMPNIVMIMRLLKALFKKNKKLCILGAGFLESIIYSEFKDLCESKSSSRRNDYILKGVLLHIVKALRAKKCPSFWNERLNLIKHFEEENLISRTYNEIKNLDDKLYQLKNSQSLEYEEFFEFFEFKMDPCSYEVDQFGIFKSY